MKILKILLIYMIIDAVTESKIKLQSLIPLVERSPPKNTSKPRAKHPTRILSDPETLDFIMERDTAFQEEVSEAKDLAADVVKKVAKKFNVSKNFDQPQPFYLGKKGMTCQMCLGEFGALDQLVREVYWVSCPYCKLEYHYSCIKYCKECVCGKLLRLQRKTKSE